MVIGEHKLVCLQRQFSLIVPITRPERAVSRTGRSTNLMGEHALISRFQVLAHEIHGACLIVFGVSFAVSWLSNKPLG
jgi:hypothetical protein